MTLDNAAAVYLGPIVWCRHQVEPDMGWPSVYGARDDGAGLGGERPAAATSSWW
jgi:hypothetical protein